MSRFSGIMNYKSQIGIGVIAFCGGLGLGYILGKRNKEPTYQVIPAMREEDEVTSLAETDTDAVKDFINQKLGEKFEEIEHIDPDEVEIEAVTVNIFDHEDDWDFEIELPNRKETEPYVIHKDEFFEADNDYHQMTLTYYAGDDIMADEDESPVYGYAAVVGDLLFGHGSGDANVVYVRNDKNKAEYEILKDPGLFSAEVLGLEIEPNDRVKGLKHSGDRVPKFRDD